MVHRKKLLAAFIALLTLLTLLPAKSTLAAQREVFRYASKGKSATTYSYRYDGCIETGLTMQAIDGTVKSSDGRIVNSSVYLQISQYDYCTGDSSGSWGYAELEADDFQTSKLDTATLNTTVELVDYASGTSYPVNLNVTWAGNGDSFRSKTSYNWSSPLFKSLYRSDSTTRSATAEGTIETPFGTFDTAAGYNILESVRSASMSTYKVQP